jgi:hypothetical protein
VEMEESLVSSIVTKAISPLILVASRHFPLTLIISVYDIHASPNRDSKHKVRTRFLGKNIFLTHYRGNYFLQALTVNFAI